MPTIVSRLEGADTHSNAIRALEGYHELQRKKNLFIYISFISIIILGILGLTFGASKTITLSDVIDVLLGNASDAKERVIWNIRLPRVLCAILGGIGLSISGAATQSVLRNPLASPYTLGISSASAFGTAFAVVVLNAGTMYAYSQRAVEPTNPYLMILSSFAFAMACSLFVVGISRIKGSTRGSMVLAGIALGSIFSAGLLSLQYFANQVQLTAIVYWQFGNLTIATWNDFIIMLLIIVPILILFMNRAWEYNAIDAGEDTARSLGVNVERTRNVAMVLASLSTAVVISLFGIIGFVCLIVPHIVRKFVGGDERFVIPASAFFGGAFLLFSDVIARTLFSPTVIPVGIFTSLIGVPIFIALLFVGDERW